ncbi:putative magnesium/proton exchanger [Tripterygium wilfordii]|uniref:Putative magnesium/proton exchanger n=1 Tax=Tripterygium wilfordii TaxID=458696 RepID=A0A7J7CET6_TRIWF|nr:putative magnesium/proton exchanger [Tripterygium wilfordii]
MGSHSVIPDIHTFPFLIQCFNPPSHLLTGKQIHAQTLFFGLDGYRFVQTSLTNMYSCYAILDLAHKCSMRLSTLIYRHGIPSLTSMLIGIVGIAQNLFGLMPERNVIAWFLGVVCACARGGLVNEGEFLRRISKEYAITPLIQQY